MDRSIPRASRRLVLLFLLAALLSEKTPTALCGPPGDTGGGDWKIAAEVRGA